MTTPTLPQWPYSASATIRLTELLNELRTHTPVGRTDKPEMAISHAEWRTRELVQRLRRGASRGEIDLFTVRKTNLARVVRPFGLVCHFGVTEKGATYQATRPGDQPSAFAPDYITVVL